MSRHSATLSVSNTRWNPSRSGQLRIGTALTGAATALVPDCAPRRVLRGALGALLLAMPVAAHAADECGAPIGGTVTCDPAAGYPGGITYQNASAAPPQDLTVVIGDGYRIATSAPDGNGLSIVNAGAITVSAGGGSIVTTGKNADGIHAYGDKGDVAITGGTVETSGDLAFGINAQAFDGSVAIATGDLTTHGAGAIGIAAHASGDITIVADDVRTEGFGSPGVLAQSRAGTVSVTTHSVTTLGDRANGIDASTEAGVITIDAGDVSTAGQSSYAIKAVALDGSGDAPSHDITIHAGAVTTGGDYAPGIVALDYHPGGAVSIYADSVTTSGNGSIGAYGYTADGLDRIAVGSVTTSGDGATGIVGLSGTGDVYVGTDKVATSGNYANGIDVYAGGAATVIANTVETHGDHARGINVYTNYGGIYVSAGTITTDGAHTSGIRAASYAGTVYAVAGSVTAHGDYGAGIVATSVLGDVDVAANTIETDGLYGVGAYAHSGSGDVVLKVGDVTTHGAIAEGISAGSTTGSVTVIAGTVTTTGYSAPAIVARSTYGNVKVTAGTVDTSGDFSSAILASSNTANVSVTADSVSTHGNGSAAVLVASYGGDGSLHANSITTSGNYSDAVRIDVAGAGSAEIGSVTTSGDRSGGISVIARGYGGSASVKANNVTTSGDYSTGIRAGGASVSVEAGSVTTTGTYSTAVNVLAVDGTGSVKLGDVVATGLGSVGIYAHSRDALTIVANSVKADMDGTAILAVADYNALDLDVGSAIGTVSASLNAGDLSVRADTVVAGGQGVSVNAPHGHAEVEAGSVTTHNPFGRGISVTAEAADITVLRGISTAGYSADGVQALIVGGDGHVDNRGLITTAGSSSIGISLVGIYGHLAIDSAQVVTSGDGAQGIFLFGDTRGTTGSVTADSVITRGDHADGIYASMKYDNVVGGVSRSPGTQVVAAGSTERDGAIAISAKNVAVSGTGSIGIHAVGMGTIDVTAGNVSARDAQAIDITAGKTATLAVTGVVKSGADAITVTGSDAAVKVAADGTVSGGDNGIVIAAAGAYVIPTAPPGYGGVGGFGIPSTQDAAAPTARIDNAGTIIGGTGYAILVGQGVADVTNSGTIKGAVKFTGADDLLTNSGTFVATRDSDFGGGADRLVNSGVFAVQAGSKPGAVTLLGLERFENSGTIDLRNGVAGDTLTLTGDYIASGNARLGLDVDGKSADALVVIGAATGHTGIALSGSAASATLLAAPITLIKAGAGTTADAFSLIAPDVGLIHYGLAFDAASGNFRLTGQAGAEVYRALDIPRAAQAIWQRGADGWEAHMAETRDTRFAGGDGADHRLWGQFYGGVDNQRDHRTLDGTRIDTGYRQDYYGAQIGLDLAGKVTDEGGMLFGITGSYVSSKLDGRGSGDRTRFDTIELGAYAGLISGPLFANLLGQYGHDWLRASNTALSFSDKLNGDSYGGQLQVGARFGQDSFYVEPVASLTYVRTSLDTLQVLGQTIDFDDRDGLRGKIGGRIGGVTGLGGGKAVFYLQASYVHEFKGRDGLLFGSGGIDQDIRGARPGGYGQGAAGVNILSAGRLSGFIEGNVDAGGGTRGGGGRVGVSFRL